MKVNFLAKVHYILFYLDCGIHVGYCHFLDFMWDICGIVCYIFMCRKISTKMWDICGIWEKVKLKIIFKDILCGRAWGEINALYNAKSILSDNSIWRLCWKKLKKIKTHFLGEFWLFQLPSSKGFPQGSHQDNFTEAIF